MRGAWVFGEAGRVDGGWSAGKGWRGPGKPGTPTGSVVLVSRLQTAPGAWTGRRMRDAVRCQAPRAGWADLPTGKPGMGRGGQNASKPCRHLSGKLGP